MATAVLCLFLSAPLSQAQVGPAPLAALYYPTWVGTRWVYKEGADELTLVVRSVDDKDGGHLVGIAEEAPDGRQLPYANMLVSDKGVFSVAFVAKYETPVCLLRLPLRPGDPWEFQRSFSKTSAGDKGVATASALEEVVVPAGKFKAVRVVIDAKAANGQAFIEEYWFAPGVGIVKAIDREGQVRVLKAFTRGK